MANILNFYILFNKILTTSTYKNYIYYIRKTDKNMKTFYKHVNYNQNIVAKFSFFGTQKQNNMNL